MARTVLALLALAAGCGPLGATSVIADAEVAVARAHAADGDTHAVYETTAADLYLAKAREEQGRARYSAAMDLAKKSVALADAAVKRAADVKKNPDASAPALPALIERQGDRPAPAPEPRREVIIPGGKPAGEPPKKAKEPIVPVDEQPPGKK